MPSLLLSIFLLQLIIHLLNTVGASTINNLLWHFYTRLPFTSASTSVSHQHRLRNDVLRLKREMNATSSQDQFARWAKLRRQHDKAQVEYDEIASQNQSTRSSFDLRANGVRWAATNGVKLVLQFRYSSYPVFEIPGGWAPGIIEWLLSFPRVKRGGVSVQVWGWACGVAIRLMGEAVAEVWVRLGRRGIGAGETRRVEVGAGTGTSTGMDRRDR